MTARAWADSGTTCSARAFILAGMEELETLVRNRFERFGTAGHGRRIKPIPLTDMARRYADGNLDPRKEAA